jgi:hypothetical protein
MSRKILISAAVAALANLAAAAPQTDTIQGSPDAGPRTDLSNQSGSLSEKLSRTNGVIRPEGVVDPQMEKEAPHIGTTPVIPPPGGSNGRTESEAK